MLRTIQPMPALDADAYAALRDDISVNGIVTPIITDQHGRIIDGNNRSKIAHELHITCPSIEKFVADDNEAVDLAVTLNCARRHLSNEQRREVIRAEIIRRPDNSDRAIARRVGCSPSTVGAVRNPKVSKLDTLMTRDEAEQHSKLLADAFWALSDGLYAAAQLAMSNGVATTLIVGALLAQRRAWERDETIAAAASTVFDPIIDYVLDPLASEFWRPHFEGPHFMPMSDAEIADLMATLDGTEVIA